ncbi:MAG: response regulator [Geodermatophilaceae bacterium]
MRVVLAEDNALLRAGLIELLIRAGFEVVGEAADAVTLLDLVRDTRPDVAILDVRMPPTPTVEGLAAASVAEGRSNRSVAAALHVSEKTVEACTGRIFSKLGLDATPDSHRRVRAVLSYLQQTTA